MGNSGQIRSEAMSTETELLEVNNWRLVGSTSSLYPFVIYGPDWFGIRFCVGLILWNG
jgi:hypothetical protein